MTLEVWRPMRELRRLADEMERMMEETLGPLELPVAPTGIGRTFPVNIYEKDNDLIVEAALPGVRPEDVDISISGRTLTISAERKETKEIKEEDYYRHEIAFRRYHRTMTLPVDVQADKAEATFEHGILRLRLPEVGAAKKVPIRVKSSGH